jgi:hypothetical protein
MRNKSLMAHPNRVFILGAGFSKPAGMPLATDLYQACSQWLQRQDFLSPEMRGWLDDLQRRLDWLFGDGHSARPLNIEEVFHYAHFDIEVHRLRQQLVAVGRNDGHTPWSVGAAVKSWLSQLEQAVRDVILESEDRADLAPITRWAESLRESDTVLTFNYDTLVERAISNSGKTWHHATGRECETGIAVCKLHGSIDWLIADRREELGALDLLFEKQNTNQPDDLTGHAEDDCRLWRCRTREQLREWIATRDCQLVQQNALHRNVGIAGLGAYKPLHQVPGLGQVWTNGMRALDNTHSAIVVGFSMSDFDAMAQMQFAEVARTRFGQGRPLPVTVIDPGINDNPIAQERFRRVFRRVEFDNSRHESFDWTQL